MYLVSDLHYSMCELNINIYSPQIAQNCSFAQDGLCPPFTLANIYKTGGQCPPYLFIMFCFFALLTSLKPVYFRFIKISDILA